MSIIVALSGGKASAWCANWALQKYPKDQVILYFNDTKWEHPDLYRFLDDLEKYFNHPIIRDNDGRNPEELFIDKNLLGSNLTPHCSAVLKAIRLKNFYKDGDTLIFGIGPEEKRRVNKIILSYARYVQKKQKFCIIKMPLVENDIGKAEVDQFLKDAGLEEPELYKLGFSHNNCYGGCVRQGKKGWKLLYETFPDIYASRERLENYFSEMKGRRTTFMPTISLTELRQQIESNAIIEPDNIDDAIECIGVCDLEA